MEELLELRICLEQRRYDDALAIVSELEEMSKEDKINKIGSFVKILLIHSIKRHAEQRTTRLWDTSIANAVYEIRRTNRRRKAGGFYVTNDDIREVIDETYPYALKLAALEALEGRYDADKLQTLFDAEAVCQETYQLLVEEKAM